MCVAYQYSMGRQIYFYYLEWLFLYNQNKGNHITVLLFLNNQNITKMRDWLFTNNQNWNLDI